MADKHEQQDQIMAELREAIAKYGPEAGPKLVRERYPDSVVSKPTWYRWLRKLNASPLDVAVLSAKQAAKKAGKSLPVAPPPQYMIDRPTEARGNVKFMTRLEHLYQDAELLRAWSMTEDGQKIRVPAFFAQSVKLRSDLLERALQALQQIYDLEYMQKFYDTVVSEIAKTDPEAARTIMEKLQKLNEERGFRA